VKEGDSLSRIAIKLGVRLPELLSANDLELTSLILPGQELVVPGGGEGSTGGGSGGGSGGTYTVKAGDSLSVIASRHQVKLGALLKANDMTVNSLIMPGMTLTLPAGAVSPGNSSSGNSSGGSNNTSGGGGGTYTVKAGDSLSLIASKYKVKLGPLLAANGMTVDSLILPGMTLTLPAGASVPSSTPSQQSPSSAIQTVLDFALAQQGKPYLFAASGPDAYDCSGLTKRAYAQIGITLIHQSAAQATQGSPVDFHREPIRPGDLVFMATRGNDVISHVGIAIDSDTWIQARRPGDVVRVGPMPSIGSIVAVRRYV
jgi:peptidoglycan endopeptidase LytE